MDSILLFLIEFKNVIIEFFCVLSAFNSYAVVFRIFLAALIGGCVGYERSQHGRAAGLRTHVLVCVGASITVLAGLYTATYLGFSNDPLRIGAQVVSGIGFLGAGTILTRNKAHVTGLTTAAGLWTTACIGLVIGMGFYLAGVLALVVIWIASTLLTRLERKTKNRMGKSYYLEINDITKVNEFCDLISDQVVDLQIITAKSGMPNHVGMICFIPDACTDPDLIQRIRSIDETVIAVPTT